MEVISQEVREYIDERGRNLFRAWLHNLKDVVARARIRVRLNRLRLGNFGDCRSVGGGVQELRIFCGPGYRVYFGTTGKTIVVLLCGGDKKTQGDDIQRAQNYWKDYQRRTS
jgi:putative addiction module killer protein